MSKLASLVLIAGLAASAVAFQPAGQPKPATPPSGQPADSHAGHDHAQPPAGQAATPMMDAPPPARPPVAVPDMPVVETKDVEGIKLEELKVGSGAEVKPGGTVVAFYHGTLKSDGSVFDSAFERGEPIPFSLNGVIQGWQKGVPGMKVGGIRRLTIPAALAYGEQGRPKIPANSDLVFVIQLEDTVYFEDVSPGTGEEASFPCVAVTAQTIKDKDGKEISKAESTNPYIWIPGEMQISQQSDAFQTAIEGMKVGGKRKVHIPKEINIASPAVTSRPTGVACDFEVELMAVRNLRPKAPK